MQNTLKKKSKTSPFSLLNNLETEMEEPKPETNKVKLAPELGNKQSGAPAGLQRQQRSFYSPRARLPGVLLGLFPLETGLTGLLSNGGVGNVWQILS